MKFKIVTAAAMLALSGTASALDVGVTANYDYSTVDNRSGAGITIGQKYGTVGITAGVERYTKDYNQTRWSVVGSADIMRVGYSTVAVKAGAVYLDNQQHEDGYAWVVGAGLDYPLTKRVALTADYRYQIGQDRIEQYDGSSVTMGVKYSF